MLCICYVDLGDKSTGWTRPLHTKNGMDTVHPGPHSAHDYHLGERNCKGRRTLGVRPQKYRRERQSTSIAVVVVIISREE